MSLSKRYYDSTGCPDNSYQVPPIFEVGQRFTVKKPDGRLYYQKNLVGEWEIVNTNDSPSYMCVRVLKNGKLSKSEHLDNKRRFFVSEIKRCLNIE